MPISQLNQLTDIALEIQRIQPKRVADLGVGFGLYGVLCREILDGWYGRCRRDQWEVWIEGWEIFPRYFNPCWDAYDIVHTRDFTRGGALTFDFDLVLLLDSLEHVAPERGRPFLRQLVERNRHVIVSVPNGRMDQGEVYGNPHEAHMWTFDGLEEFAGYKYKLLHQSICTVVSIEGDL